MEKEKINKHFLNADNIQIACSSCSFKINVLRKILTSINTLNEIKWTITQKNLLKKSANSVKRILEPKPITTLVN